MGGADEGEMVKIDEIITCGLPLVTNNEELNIFHGQALNW